MEKKINKTNIIALALTYNYISNGVTSLSMYKLERFKTLINKYIHSDFMKEFISEEEDDNQEVYYYTNDKKIVGLINQNELINFDYIEFKYIEQIPQYVLISSLKEDVLSSIDVDRNKLKTKKISEWKSDVVGIYTSSAEKARKSARESLEAKGYKNIKIGTAIPFQRGDKGYDVNAFYDAEVIYLDIYDSINANPKILNKKI